MRNTGQNKFNAPLLPLPLTRGTGSSLLYAGHPHSTRPWAAASNSVARSRVTTAATSGGGDAGEKKETTLDRIFGPKLFKTVENWKGVHMVPVVLMRVIAGSLMIHHGSEGGLLPANFGTNEFQGFTDFIIKPYFGFLPGAPELWSALHDYVEFFGGILLIVGLFVRPTAFALFVTMLSAVYFHLSSTGLQGYPFGHVENYSYNWEEPALYACIFLQFFFNGAGPLSVDSCIYKSIAPEDVPEDS